MYTYTPTTNPYDYPGKKDVEAVKRIVGEAVGQKFAFNNGIAGFLGNRRAGNVVKWWFKHATAADVEAYIRVAESAMLRAICIGDLKVHPTRLEVRKCSDRSAYPGFRVIIKP